MMQYENEYEVRGSDLDTFDRMHPASVLALFQDVAGIHATALGVGFAELREKNTIWVLTRIRYRVVRQPKRYERLRVSTWPLPPGRVSFRREYLIETLGGEPLIYGSSEWAVVHREERRVMPARDLYPSDDYRCDTYFEGRLPRIPHFEVAGEGREVVPTFSDLDVNGHVNNTKYAIYALDTMPPAEEDAISEFAIDYHREVMQDQPLRLYGLRQDDEVLVRGVGAGGETMFNCRMGLTRE